METPCHLIDIHDTQDTVSNLTCFLGHHLVIPPSPSQVLLTDIVHYSLKILCIRVQSAKCEHLQTHKDSQHVSESVKLVLKAKQQPRYSLLKPKVDVFEIPEFKYI